MANQGLVYIGSESTLYRIRNDLKRNTTVRPATTTTTPSARERERDDTEDDENGDDDELARLASSSFTSSRTIGKR